MHRAALIAAPAFVIALALAACADAPRGTLITGDGRVLANTASNWRDEKSRAIATQLSQRLQPHGRAEVAIAELPVWVEDSLGGGRGWELPRATVAVVVIGDGQPLPETPASIRAAVVEFLRPSVERGARNIAVEVQERVDPPQPAGGQPQAGDGQAAAAGQQPATAPSPWPKQYLVQQGDTLADISALFYGTTRHWRRIVEANPGLDPTQLAAGATLTIPAPPDPAR